ncbi:MAG: glucosamine--fructose-6-phosphate aminotransferase (isomerizing) [Flavobacteriales bacterium]|jgi:glucosamine--fructose-6-phosphate aminotransferase (isomerizing)
MCGIVGYIGDKQAFPIIMDGLQRLEYRGYDSAGVVLQTTDNALKLFKCKGKVADLRLVTDKEDVSGSIGIGHTRWATHGAPNDVNAHPHYSQSGELVMIHNGIIENYASLKEALIERGYTFKSDTDTEVLINLIEDIYQNEDVSLEEATRLALNQVIGAYAIAILSTKDNNKIVAARKGSPLVIGVSDNEYFIASDASPFIQYTKNAVYLEDGEIAVMQRGKELRMFTIANDEVTPYVHELQLTLEAIEKGGFEHFMLKEIFEQPKSILDTLRGRLLVNEGVVKMASITEYEQKLLNAKRIVIIACGTSWHAGLVAEYLFEDIARIPVEVEYASEFRYRNPIISENDVVIAISQSGETADTLAAIDLAKSKGATIFGICNVVGSSIARATDTGAYTHAGPEIGVASTKAFTSQVALLTLIALALGNRNGALTRKRFQTLAAELEDIPNKIEKVLELDAKIKIIATEFKDVRNFLYLGRGYNFPVALEGALKLKEISYIHAEGYPAAEMKHGPIALIDEEMPVVVIATKNTNYEKVLSNIQEVKARSGRVIALVTEGDKDIKGIADYIIEVPEVDEALSPLINTVPLQLLSYHIAVMRGCNVDQPRNLAKSVTVE